MQNESSKKKLGIWTTTSLVIGNMIGAGVFLLPAALATYGGIGLIGWVVSAAGAIFLARVFSEASKMIPGSDGGPYAFTRAGFGDFTGYLIAWGYWISVWCANATITVSLISALSTFFPVLATNPVVAIITGLSAIWIITWINTLGIVTSGRMQLITTILKLVPIILIALIGFFYIDWSHFRPFNQSGMSALAAISASATMTFYAFLGVECASIPGGSVENPEKTIPRATMYGTLITTLVYILSTVSIMGILNIDELKKSVTPFADTAVRLWGHNASYWVSAGVAIAALGALNGWILIQGQVSAAIAKDKLFPAIFKKENKRGVPALGIVIGSVLISLLMIMNFTKGLVEQFQFMLLLSTLTALVPYLFVAAAWVMMSIQQKKLSRGGWTKLLLTATFSFVFSLLAIIGSGEKTVFWGFVLLLAGIPFYVWSYWKEKSGKK